MKKYEVILQDLEKKIKNGSYPPNSLLPSENEMTSLYGASRATVRQALKVLADNGMVHRRHGFGSIVIPQEKLLFPVTGLISFKELQETLGFEAETDVLYFEPVTINRDLSALTTFPIGTQAYHVLRRRKIEGKYAILDRDFFICDVAEGLSAEHAKASIYDYLEKELQLDIAYAQKGITVDLVTDDDKKFLDLEPLDRHIVSVKSVVYLQDNRPFQYTESHYQVDKFRFSEFARRQKA